VVKRDDVIEVECVAAEGVVAVGWGDVLLKLRQVVDLQVIVEERGLNACAFAELRKGRLRCEAGGHGFGEDRSMDGLDSEWFPRRLIKRPLISPRSETFRLCSTGTIALAPAIVSVMPKTEALLWHKTAYVRL